ncbi:MAG: nucleotidyltransferase domain-containing protein [Planctomycetota bacterium]
MKSKYHKIARELKKRLSQVTNLIDFKVFGSLVRGDNDEYSDMDVFLEVEKLERKTKSKILDVVWETGFKHSIVISPLIFTRHEIEKSPLRVSPIVKNIAREGIAV